MKKTFNLLRTAFLNCQKIWFSFSTTQSLFLMLLWHTWTWFFEKHGNFFQNWRKRIHTRVIFWKIWKFLPELAKKDSDPLTFGKYGNFFQICQKRIHTRSFFEKYGNSFKICEKGFRPGDFLKIWKFLSMNFISHGNWEKFSLTVATIV